MSLNERVLRARRSLPDFRELPALAVRAQLADEMEINLAPMPLADALELKLLAVEQGFCVQVRRMIPESG